MLHSNFLSLGRLYDPMGTDGESGRDLESLSKEGSARVSRDQVHDQSSFYKQLKKVAPDFPYRATACPRDPLTPQEGSLDFYMKRFGEGSDSTKIIHISTQQDPNVMGTTDLATIAGESLKEQTPPEDKYVCLRFRTKQ